MRDYSPLCSNSIYGALTCGHENAIRWDRDFAFAGGFLFFYLWFRFKGEWAQFLLHGCCTWGLSLSHLCTPHILGPCRGLGEWRTAIELGNLAIPLSCSQSALMPGTQSMPSLKPFQLHTGWRILCTGGILMDHFTSRPKP